MLCFVYCCMQRPDSLIFELVRQFIEVQETAAYTKYHNSTVDHQEAINIRGGDRAADEHQLCNKELVGQANCLCTECLNAECQSTWLTQIRLGREKQGWTDTLVAWSQAWNPGRSREQALIPWGAPGHPPAPLPAATLDILSSSSSSSSSSSRHV